MHIVPPALGAIDLDLSEIGAIIEALIFMQEEGEPARVHNATVALLYIAHDKLASALRSSNQLHRLSEVAN